MQKKKYKKGVTLKFNTAHGLDLEDQYGRFMEALPVALRDSGMKLLRGTRPKRDAKWNKPIKVTFRIESDKKINDLKVLAVLDDACHILRDRAVITDEPISSQLCYDQGGPFEVKIKYRSDDPALTV